MKDIYQDSLLGLHESLEYLGGRLGEWKSHYGNQLGDVKVCVCVFKKQPVEGAERRNPAPPGMYETPMNDGINYLSTGAGFLPSTVCHGSNVTHYQKLHHIVRSPFLWGFWPMFVGFLHLYSAQTLDGLKTNHPL